MDQSTGPAPPQGLLCNPILTPPLLPHGGDCADILHLTVTSSSPQTITEALKLLALTRC